MTNKPLGTLDLTSNKFITPVYGNSGDHRMHGIMIGRGANLRNGLIFDSARIIDYAPTILHTLSIEVPADMDGRVLEEIFTEAYMRENPVRRSGASVYEGASDLDVMSDEDSEEIRERLRALGYLG
jgi:hypothetical protein